MSAVDETLALVSLAGAKEHLKESSTDSDSILGELINEVSEFCNSYCKRHLLSKSYVEYYDGNGRDRLHLQNSPVSALTSLYNAESNREFDSDSLVTIADDVLLNKEEGVIRLWDDETYFIKAKANVKVTYTAGWALSSVPGDLQLAVYNLIGVQYKLWQEQRYTVQSDNVGSRSRAWKLENIPSDVKLILDNYLKPDFGFNDYSHKD